MYTKFLKLALVLLICTTSCKKDNNDDDIPVADDAAFALWIQLGTWPNTSYYALNVNDLTQGSTKLQGNGIDVTTKLNNSVIVKDGFYYFYNAAEGRLGKYKLENGAVNVVKEVPFSHLASLAGHTWVNDHTLVMIGNNASGDAVNTVVIDTDDLSITTGTITGLPQRPESYNKYLVGGDLQFKDGKLFFSVNMQNTTAFRVYPRLYTMAVSYPGFAVTNISTDDRSVGVGNTSGYFATSFVDHNGDMYFLTSWNLVWNENGSRAPKGIYRIKKGEDELDKTYYVDVLQETGKEAAAGVFMDLGNGKAILKVQEMEGYENTKFGYIILDLATGNEVRKLTEIPAVASGERNIYVEDGKAYIAVLSGQGTDYIWIYDADSDKVTRGLSIQGGYNSFSRIDKLK
ncbi:DUF4374 domain-containing protein [Sphingobacterium alkalisoli]|uniref:DUF4374 domain-containing protein n=1 Tax=Sphingobacterium alkalisoli TaxID=1874115 RepID=A0A4U0H2S2_9SPHI|nr:DUF4374 domain-containing protein [Sphingobacterium alkalisoli]TJY65786.1 DUF4374 domain-containing protein [Sphingobacterium alkalisoli]GGH18322.1 hypothetical protein GCM10011418_21880 [Sphingobacterium alkalisoli]